MATHPSIQKISIPLLQRRASALGCRADAQALEKLAGYGDLIGRWNRRKRIVGKADPEELVGVHLSDAMALAGKLQGLGGGTLLDVGSGAGLPGFVLAMLVPDLGVTLCEVSEKRVSFLHHARRTLGVDVEILHKDVKALAEQSSRFTHVVSRAVFEPSHWIEVGRPLVADGGFLWCMLTEKQHQSCGLSGDTFFYEVAGQRQRVLLRL